MENHSHHGRGHAAPDAPGDGARAGIAIDPVCGMDVTIAGAKHRHDLGGETFYFCSGRCRERFAAEPERYRPGRQTRDEPPPPAYAVYTCPMHPEVRKVGPGTCPICGMALEPEQVGIDDAPNPELADMTRRFWIGLALAAPVFVLEMGSHLLGLRARERTGGAIRALLDLAPKAARRVSETGDEEVPLEAIQVGDACACAPARRFRSTARSSRARASSTNRW